MMNNMRLAKIVSLIMLGSLGLAWDSAEGALLAYDGFASGGSNPAAGQYRTVQGSSYQDIALAWRPSDNPASTGGQNPSVLGFVDAWIAPNEGIGYTAQSVYFQASSVSLNYTSPDSITLPASNGSARLFRSGSGTINKQVYRDLNIGTAPTVAYFSVLVNFDAGQPILFQTQTLGAVVKPLFGFGVDSAGVAYLSTSPTVGSAGTTMAASGTLTSGTTHLMVVKVEEIAGTSDRMTLYLNPDLASEASNTADVVLDGDFYVANNAAYSFTNLFITGTPNNGSFYFDEFKIGTSWADILAVPEPQKMALCFLGLGLAMLRRRRR